MAVKITRTNMTVQELRLAAAKSKDAKAARRMLAIALLLDGVDRKLAAESCGMDRQTLRDWVHRYNAEGLPGLSNRRPCGSSCLLSPTQKADLATWERNAPDPAADGVVRWRRVDLKRQDRGTLRCDHARAHGRQTLVCAGVPAAVGAPPAP